MRIISGACKGRSLVSIKGRDIRPTSDRVREAIFNILGDRVRGARVLDLFAGTGALGIEALSRGAGSAVFVDNRNEALRVVRQNVSLCGFLDRARLVRHDISRGIGPLCRSGAVFELVFLDPPYGRGCVQPALEHLVQAGCLALNAVLVVESDPGEPVVPDACHLRLADQRRYGRTLVSFLEPHAGKDPEMPVWLEVQPAGKEVDA